MPHSNDTQNTSFLDVLTALRNNIFKTLNTSDLFIVREITEDRCLCESLTNSNIKLHCIKLKDLEVAVNDVALAIFTSQDFRASLNAYKTNTNNRNIDTTDFHSTSYGIIIGIVYRRT